jgi:tetratricopeptide (TPR) repeat protein
MRSRLLVLFALIITAAGFAQTPAPADPDLAKDKAYAIGLERSGKYEEALPWLQKLHERAPKDPEITQALADVTLVLSSAVTDLEQQRQQRVLARQLFQQAIDQGVKEPFAAQMVSYLPADGNVSKFSDNPEVHRLVAQGEAAFAKGNLDEAKDWYVRAVVLDPKNYDAALFAGDMYYRKKDPVAAGEWYARAIQIDPDQEPAYRYWGDALMARGKFSEAREKYIQAVIANPYSEFVWNGVNNFLKGTNQKATWYKIKPQANVTTKENNNINITLNVGDGKKDDPGGVVWMMYGISRAAYQGEKFKKEFPNEPKYRHTLKEESEALSLAADGLNVKDDKKKKKHEQPLPDDLAALARLKSTGFIEPYVLFNAADNDIVKDYIPYRKVHRDLLVRYLSEIVIPPAPSDTADKP